MWLAAAAGSAFFAGATAVLAKCGIKNVNSNLAMAIRCVVVALFSWLMAFITMPASADWSVEPRTMVFLCLSGLATGASWLCYFRALQLGDVNKVTPVDKFSIVLTIILAAIFLGEHISLSRGAALIMITAGTYLMIEKKHSAQPKPAAGHGWFFYAALSTVFASLTSILGKIGISNIPSNYGSAIRTTVVLAMAWLLVLVSGRTGEIKKIDLKSLAFICVSGITTGASWLCYYYALQNGKASCVVPIDKLSILVTTAFSAIFLKERLSAKAAAGLAAITAGTLLMVLLEYI